MKTKKPRCLGETAGHEVRGAEKGWWKRFVKEVGFEPGVRDRGVMYGEIGESTEEEAVIRAGKAKSEIDWDEVDREKHGLHFRDKVRHIERNDHCYT